MDADLNGFSPPTTSKVGKVTADDLAMKLLGDGICPFGIGQFAMSRIEAAGQTLRFAFSFRIHSAETGSFSIAMLLTTRSTTTA